MREELGIFPSPVWERQIQYIDIFHIFLHIYCIKEFRNVTWGRGVYSGILTLLLGSRTGNFSKSLGHFPEYDVIKGGGGSVLANPEIT